MWVQIPGNIPNIIEKKSKINENVVKGEQDRKYLVDAVAQRIGDAANDGPADFPCCHFPEFGRGHVRVESGMWSANQIGNFFQRTFNTSRNRQKKSSRNVAKKMHYIMPFVYYLGTRCRVRFRGHRELPPEYARLSGPEPKPIRRRGHLEPCWLKRRQVSSAWWCTRWSGGGCARSMCSEEKRNPIGRANPRKRWCHHNSVSIDSTRSIYLERVDPCQTQRAFDTVWKIGVVKDDIETKGFSPQGDSWSDSTCSQKGTGLKRGV